MSLYLDLKHIVFYLLIVLFIGTRFLFSGIAAQKYVYYQTIKTCLIVITTFQQSPPPEQLLLYHN